MVRLLLNTRWQGWSTATGFNPTMVRLLLAVLFEGGGRNSLFQSHNGAIAASS